MSTRTTNILTIAFILLGTALSVIAYPDMPEISASHWNAAGEVDGYMSRFWATFMMPVMAVGLFLMFLIIPSIDPLKKNIAQFREQFNIFIALIIFFLLYIHILTLLWNTEYARIDIGAGTLPAVGLLFAVAGWMMSKAKRNFFIGIRTPWTLSNDEVWDKTHALGSKLFIIAGIVTALSVFLGQKSINILLPTIFIAALVPMVYSYILFARLPKDE